MAASDGAGLQPRVRTLDHRPFPLSPEMAPGVVRIIEAGLLLVVGLATVLFGARPEPGYAEHHLFCIVFIVVAYAGLSEWANLNTTKALMRPIATAERVVIAVITCFMILMSILVGLDAAYVTDMQWLWFFFLSTIVVTLAARLAAFEILRRLSRHKVIGRNLAVLGVGAQSARLVQKIARDPPYFAELVGVFSPEPVDRQMSFEGAPVIGSIDTLLACVREGLIDDVVVAMPWSANQGVIDTIEQLKELPVNVYLGTDLVGFDLTFTPVLGIFSELPVYEVVQRPISGWSSTLKSILDYSAATAALLVLSPLLALIAVAIKIDSPGPVFFMQDRLGFNNKRFAIYKFRSMVVGADKDLLVRQATRNDPRVTRVGRVIRATSLDELPQLLNVLDGTMSLVGPRPHAVSHNEEYGRQIRGYFARHKVKPGITGWAQINGYRGETADIEKMRRRIEHDIYYTENWSLVFDIKILIMTAAVVLFQRSAY